MKRNKKISILTFCCVFFLLSCSQTITEELNSPNGDIKLCFTLKDGVPAYNVCKGEEVLIEDSEMGFKFINEEGVYKNLKLLSAERKSVNETWEQPWGEFKEITDKHNELKLELQGKGGKKCQMNIVFRVFDDGVGFRYEFPKQANLDSVKIGNELTQFSFPEEPSLWWIPVHRENSYYESFYRKTKVGETDTINTPATFETAKGTYFAIHEANLTDFASMTLLKKSNIQFESELVPWSTGVKVYAKTPFVSPWRTIIIGDKPGDLATSTMMLNLNEPCQIEDTSWIKPSKYLGIWWSMHLYKSTWYQGPKHGASTANAKRYIDFASANDIGGVLVEGWNYGWDGDWVRNPENIDLTKAYPDFDLEEVCRYAELKGVNLIGHHETAGAVSQYESQMDKAFGLYEKNKVNAVKTGYVNKYLDGKEWHDGQFAVRHYRRVIETAAKHHIMINNHEPVKGTGLQRTFPNLMTQEGARGQEYDAWSDDGGNPPNYTTILPFTRMLAGPFDMTFGTFDFDYDGLNDAKVQTTLAKQLALYVVIYSPQQMASDLPENYAGNPAFEFVKQVPTNWSQTKVIDSKIGEFVVTARQDRDSKDWYLGAITNEKEREVNIDLSFLDKSEKYEAQIYRDGENANYKDNPYPITIETTRVSASDTINIKLAKGGGLAIRFVTLEL
ncbi:MAG: glycoside hydrolase family 97 protein [Bacteroidales bacterium]